MLIYREMGVEEYTPPEEAQELWDRINDQGKLIEFECYIDDTYANGLISEMELDDMLRYQSEELEELLDLEPAEDEEDEDEEADETDINDYDQDERGY